MSNQRQNGAVKRLTVGDLWMMKQRGEKFCSVSSSDYNTAMMVDEAGIEMTGGGGSLVRMVMGGEPTPYRATLEDAVLLIERIAPAVKRAIIIGSLPYGSLYQVSDELALRSAIRLVQAGAHVVKVAGVSDTLLERVKAIAGAGIPVMGHVGLVPEFFHKIGGYKVVGKTSEEAVQIYHDVKRLERAGASIIEMECVPEKIAAEICKRTQVPIMGIGSGPGTDGQALMHMDMLGLQRTLISKIAKRYVDLWPVCVEAYQRFSEETKTGAFPTSENTFTVSDEVFAEFVGYIEASTGAT